MDILCETHADRDGVRNSYGSRAKKKIVDKC
jgi:hypothetical protein